MAERISRLLIYLGMALVAVFAGYSLYTGLASENLSPEQLFGAAAMLGVLLILAGTVIRQARS